MLLKQVALRSFLEIAPDSHFPVQNLPYGIFRRDPRQTARIGVAIGSYILDLYQLSADGFFHEIPFKDKTALRQATLNAFLAEGPAVWQALRDYLQNLLSAQCATLRDHSNLRDKLLAPMDQAQMLLPVNIGDYTDFYSSREHATNVGTMFRGKDNALMPHWLEMPIAYHGRSSSIVPSGTPVRRPLGQVVPQGSTMAIHGPTQQLDFELEMGFLVGPGNALGSPIPIADASSHIFGLVLVNDWSARDIQKREYQPLGPFLGKNFATSISPWVVPLAALEPFRVAQPLQDPLPLPYLRIPGNWAYDIRLAVALQTAAMSAPVEISGSNMRYLYWSMLQQLAHHTVNGCNLRPGDLLASGTISGPTPDSYGSLLELTWNGANPIKLPSGEERRFLEDGDTLSMTAYAQGEGYRVGFGEVSGKVLSHA
jgi:fumarylacetoacetase